MAVYLKELCLQQSLNVTLASFLMFAFKKSDKGVIAISKTRHQEKWLGENSFKQVYVYIYI